MFMATQTALNSDRVDGDSEPKPRHQQRNLTGRRSGRAFRRNAMVLALAASVAGTAMAGAVFQGWDFEPYNSNNNASNGWWFSGISGLDAGKGFARRGVGNAWVRNTEGWNAVNQWVQMSPTLAGRSCSAGAWVRAERGLEHAYMSIVDADTGLILNEIRVKGVDKMGGLFLFPKAEMYWPYSVDFYLPASGKVLFYIGLWGDGQDRWMQIDDAGVTCTAPYPQ